MSNTLQNKLTKVEDITPDIDSVNIIGQVCELQSMETFCPTGKQIVSCSFLLADETACVRTQLHKIDDLRMLKNGEVLGIKNGRVEVISNKLILTNDVWTKISTLPGKKFENVNRGVNISGVKYSLNPKQVEPIS